MSKQETAIESNKANQPREGQPRVVKKYPNRRLYDTVESRYITLADIRRLVMDKIDFVVIDKKSHGGHHPLDPAAGDCGAGACRASR